MTTTRRIAIGRKPIAHRRNAKPERRNCPAPTASPDRGGVHRLIVVEIDGCRNQFEASGPRMRWSGRGDYSLYPPCRLENYFAS